MPADPQAGDRALAALSAREAAARIRRGALSAEALVTALIRRIEATPQLGAVTQLCAATALADARQVDVARAAGHSLGRLAGVPLLVKENIDQAGEVSRAGTPGLATHRAAQDAPVLRALREAGAIPLARTNMHELALGVTTTNPATAIARNPYALDRSPGGSSGGSAAGLAAHLAPAALGTDTGASVRAPSAFCGGAALRPSVGTGGSERRYPLDGVVPVSPTRDTLGPMARTVDDVALLDSVITGAPALKPVLLRGLRLGVPRRGFWEGLDGEVATVCAGALARLAEAGVELVEVDLSQAQLLAQNTGFAVTLYEIGPAISHYLRAAGSDLAWHRIKRQVESPDVAAALAAGAGITPEAYAAALHELPALRRMYDTCFADHGVEAVLFPTTPVTAPPIDETFSGRLAINGLDQPGGPAALFEAVIRNLDVGSLAGVPGVAFPAGLTRGGLPVGLEIDGPVGADRRLLAVAAALEGLMPPLPAPSFAEL